MTEYSVVICLARNTRDFLDFILHVMQHIYHENKRRENSIYSLEMTKRDFFM